MYQCCQLLAELSGYTKGKMRLLREKALILGFWLFTYSFILIKLHQMGPKFGAFLAGRQINADKSSSRPFFPGKQTNASVYVQYSMLINPCSSGFKLNGFMCLVVFCLFDILTF
jgi:hypothetical protein